MLAWTNYGIKNDDDDDDDDDTKPLHGFSMQNCWNIPKRGLQTPGTF